MAKQNINIGVEGNDATGDSIRESFRKVNENFDELYAVFGLGGQISFLDLSDTPNSYVDNENKIPVINDTETGFNFLQLVSDNALNPNDVDSIGFDFSLPGKLVVKIVSTNISNDLFPTLGGPLNASGQPLANISEINQQAVDLWKATHLENIEIGDLVINKRYADANYQERQRAGGGIRLLPEPVSAAGYIKTISSFDSFGNPVIPNHGLSDAFLGASFVFNTTTASSPPSNIVDGQTVYIRILNANTISLHTSEAGAVNNTNRIILSGGSSGVLTLTDADYDDTLEGNWLSTVALPRESVTRRQGDRMTGPLFLHDHPGDLAGLGTSIGGSDDLQAATKLYVDRGTPTSQVNLYVSTDGDDRQTFTPAGKEGRSQSWAYRTVNAACRKAEEIIISAPFEAGPYRQTITYNNGANRSTITTAGFTAPPIGRPNYAILINENKDFIQKEVTAFIAATFPNFEYDIDICERDIGYIVDSVRLDILLGDNANYLSRWSGIRYYSNPSARKAIGEQRLETVAGIEHAKKLVRDIVQNIQVGAVGSVAGTLYQNRVVQFRDGSLITSSLAAQAVASATDAKFDIILDIIDNGPLDAPTIVDGQTTYKINMFNGNSGFVDQGNPLNTDIIPGKVVVGKNSGAIGRIISYTYESDPATITPVSNDVLEIQLLEPFEFEPGEELEYGNIVRETQVTIRVESGIYEEDYPIRVPANVSIKGDEFRRVIIRPKNRVSQSRYTDTFFYRDTTFDGLTIVSSRIEELSRVQNGGASVTRSAGAATYINVSPANVTFIDPITSAVTVLEATSGNGSGATFDITVNANGSVRLDNIVINDPGTGFVVGETITISDADIGNTGADDLILTVGKISGGKEYRNPLNGNIDGYFGYHYLLNPNSLKNTGPGFINTGGRTTAAQIVKDNKEFVKEQVLEYLAINYPSVSFSQTTCARDVGLILDAIIHDYEFGGNEKVLEAQGEYYYGALPKDGSQTAATIAGIDYIYQIFSLVLINAQPSTIYGTGLDYPQADLFNGTAETGSVNLMRNFIDTILFAFDPAYNPPLRNDEMDAFLMNDATILRNLTVQGHGGFMCVLDPEGQVLTKSPYIQTGSSFSRSLNRQVFAGGMLVDAFAGNAAVRVVATGRPSGNNPVPDLSATPDPFVLQVQSLGSQNDPQGLFVRRPQTPCPFYVDGRRFQVNAIINYDPDEGTAVLLLDKNSNDGNGFTGTTSNLITGVDLDSVGPFEFNEDKCRRDSLYILEGVAYDVALGTNYNAIVNGLAYRRGTASVVIGDQLAETVAALTVGKTETLALTAVSSNATATSRATASWNEVIDILQNGTGAADPIVFTDPGINVNKLYARQLLQTNRSYIATELTDWVTANYPSLVYNVSTCQRDVRYIVDALSYDVQYGGNSATLINARSYYDDAVSVLPLPQQSITALAMAELANIVSAIVTETYAGQTLTGNPASATEATEVSDLVGIIEFVIESGSSDALPDKINPDVSWATSELQSAKNAIENNSPIIAHRIVQSVDSPISITLQTAGNRSMLGNDFTQVNDLGYGLVCLNGALSEMVSMFTYYCWTSYYSKNGSEIRSLTGSSCYGEYGLVAEGSDPNEIPDAVTLDQDMARPAKTFTAETIITTSGIISLGAGDIVTQVSTGATGTVTTNMNGYNIYLTNVTGTFNTVNQLNLTTDSTPISLGANSIPSEVDNTGYTNDKEQLFAHLYDVKEAPSNRGEFDVYHPVNDIFARYEIANTVPVGIIVGQTSGFGDTIPFGAYSGIAGTGATFNVSKTIVFGYDVESILLGQDYVVSDTITISGVDLGGATPANDLVITVTEVDSNGGITDFTFTGTIAVTGDTPYYNGIVYRVNFATGNAQFSQDGILENGGILHDTPLQLRNNQTFIFNDIARPDILTIRPSTALVFRESETVYRSISFLSSDAVGNELLTTQSLAGFDSTYDYVRLVVDSTKAIEPVWDVYDIDGISKFLDDSTDQTKGGSKGDTTIAVTRIYEEDEVRRLNNNLLTESVFRPSNFSSPGELPMIMAWAGRKHTVYNYRGVKTTNVTRNLSNATKTNPVVITLASTLNLVAGDQITISGITTGMTQLNGTYFFNPTVGNSGELYTDSALTTPLNGTGFSNYTTGGIVSVSREVIQSTPSETDDYGIVDIVAIEDIFNELNSYDGLREPVVKGDENIILRAGLQSGSPATVTINISTCRATGHDFLDVGTGGFNTSNYPNVLFGLPRQPDQAKEVEERTKGRVFYVSTDQNGIFRVGRFFAVDQGTGTVTFSASIALSDVDGLGFKRGVVVTEFSTDTAMTDNATDTVPVESAVRGYVNRRLGFDHTGAAISNKIGPGVLAPNGSVPMTADLNADNNTITNLGVPTAPTDAATKAYVDNSRGDNDTIRDLRDTDINNLQEGQLLVSTDLKKIVIDADLVTTAGPSSAYLPGQTITGSLSGATGTIRDVLTTTGYEGNIIILTYEPVSGTFSSGPPVGTDIVNVSGVINGPCIDGPIDEFVNGVFSSDSDLQITTTRVVTTDPITGVPTSRYTEISAQLKALTIENADIAANAAISQSKLSLNAGTTRANATGISQSDLGLAAFKDTEFTTTNGFIELKTATSATDGVLVGKIQHIPTDTVLGRSAAGTGAVSSINFSTVISEGGGLEDGDFVTIIPATSDPGEALIKTGTGTYGISNVTTQGEPNSIVKTNTSGSIQVNSLILGGDSNYEILALNTTELVVKTPGQGTVLTSSGGSPGTGGSPSDPGYVAPTFPVLQVPGSLNIGSTGVSQSSLKAASPLAGESALAVDWIYSSFIEATGEKGLASTGIAIGANTGKTIAGQVGIVTASGTTTSAVPFIFDAHGVKPDFNNIYNIGSPTLRYNTVYATVFNGTATEALYADLAENYLGDEDYAPGTVLIFGGSAELTTTNIKGDRKVAGVVTTNPAHIMNSALKGDNVIGLALQGRVPCQVIGKVKKGDMLVTSAIPGYAIVDNDPKIGTVLGKAVADKNDNDKGVVEIVVGRL